MKTLLALLAATLLPAQQAQPAKAEVSYSLPQTVLVMEITTVKEEWTAGAYSNWAKDLLGIDAVMKDSTAYSISSIAISPVVEADQTKRFSIIPDEETLNNYISSTSQGLVAGKGIKVRNSSKRSKTISTPEAPVIGSRVKDAGNLEADAKAAAKRIKELQKARYDILIGNTDASYSGDALRAAVEELRRMEDELTARFTGSYRSSSETFIFEVVPALEKGDASTVYEAFCLSPVEGILPAGSADGLPYYLEISSEGVQKAESKVVPLSQKEQKKAAAKKPYQYVVCRIPAICVIRLTDGEKTVSEMRAPVYQLGLEEQYPIFN